MLNKILSKIKEIEPEEVVSQFEFYFDDENQFSFYLKTDKKNTECKLYNWAFDKEDEFDETIYNIIFRMRSYI